MLRVSVELRRVLVELLRVLVEFGYWLSGTHQNDISPGLFDAIPINNIILAQDRSKLMGGGHPAILLLRQRSRVLFFLSLFTNFRDVSPSILQYSTSRVRRAALGMTKQRALVVLAGCSVACMFNVVGHFRGRTCFTRVALRFSTSFTKC